LLLLALASKWALFATHWGRFVKFFLA